MTPFRCTPFVLALLSIATLSTSIQAQVARSNAIVKAVEKSKDSVVMIKIAKKGATRDSVGSGVIIDERGVIVTNRHVVGGFKNVSVVLANGKSLDGQVVFADASTDLAVVQVQAAEKLPALTLAPMDLKVGEDVIAIGHPYGYSNTVSRGIISALGRQITMPTGDILTGLIQIDAPINPGNSGGPLLNINGELIGINVALREGAQNIAFAINTNTVKKVLNAKLNALQVSGVCHGLDLSEKVTAEAGEGRQKVVVAAVFEQTSAVKSGLKNGDEIVAVGSMKVANSFDVERSLWQSKPGQKVELQVVRNGQTMTVNLELGDETAAVHMRANVTSVSLPTAAPTTTPISYRN